MSKRLVLLSELYQRGPVKPDILGQYRDYANTLIEKSEKTQEEKLFINDFMSAIVDIKLAAPRRTLTSTTETTSQPTNNGPAQVVKLNELVVVPEKFDGQHYKARRWLDDYIRAAVSNSWNENTMAKYFQTYMTGPASDWFAVNGSSSATWAEIRDSFCRYFIGTNENLALERMLKDASQKPSESCGTFIARYARLLNLADPEISQSKMVSAIRIRLRPEIVDRLANHLMICNLEDLNLACLSIEDNLRASRINEKQKKHFNEPHQTNSKNNKEGRRYNNISRGSQKNPAKSQTMRTCHRCQRPGHIREDCFATKDANGKELKDSPPKKPPPRKSTKVNAIEAWEEEERPRIMTIRRCSTIIANSQRKKKPSLIMQEVSINDKKVRALIDTGSEISLINAETASINGWVPQGPSPDLVGADNIPMKCHGSIRADISIEIKGIIRKAESVRFVVTENLCTDMIIGLEMLGWFQILIDPEERGILFKPEAKNINLSALEEIPPRTQKIVEAEVPIGVVGVIQTKPFNGGNSEILVANSIDKVRNGRIQCLVVNLDNKSKLLGKGLPLASYETMAMANSSQINATMEVSDSQSFVTVGDNLTENQLEELRQVLSSYKEVFSLSGELGCTTALEHDIELIENARPFAEPLRRRPVIHQEETRRQVKDMLQKGIIEESNSPWAAAYVLAKKKSGELRLCVDFRKLNDVTKKCVYPLPNVEDCIDTLAGKKYFSQLDMASGFWQLPLSSRAKELTAFRTEDGQYQFTRMPFGLTNAPASFQRLVNIVFSGLKGLNLQVFIDDLCIANDTWEEHIQCLTEVFKLLIKANLKLKCNKCTFGVPKVVFLGHEISAEGIKQDPVKLAALKNLPSPTNVKEVRSALGMLNYYRKFVPKFAIITEPITRLTKKLQPFCWKEEQETAFREVLDVLSKNGTLIHYDRRAPTALKTDACRIGIASILLQQHGDEWKIVTCRSRRLKPNEANYGVTELEALAIIEAVVKLRNYLLGIKFRIITDHCALCSVFKNNSTNSRLNRWRWILQEFDFDVVYTKGSMHSDVDCLSRAPLADETDSFLEDRVMTTYYRSAAITGLSTLATPVNKHEWKTLQDADTEVMKFSKKAEHRRDKFKFVEGLLYYNNRLYVPKPKRKSLLIASHDSEIAAHGGIKATLARLDAFWWPAMQLEVTEWCNSCTICQQRKTPREKPSGQLHSFEAEKPLELVAIDCLDLPESMNQRKHVIVAVDLFTRFVTGKAIKALKSSCFTKFLTDFIGQFGVPKQILTDNAPIFANESVKELVGKYHIEHRRSTPHHHEGNAVAERMIQTVQEKLALLVNDPNQSLDWDMALPQAFLSINTAVCSSTGFSPYELMFVRKHDLLHADLEFKNGKQQSYLNDKHEEHLSSSEQASQKQLASKRSNKTRFDARHNAVTFDIGDRIWSRKMGRISKLSNRWEGPYVIQSKVNDVYTLLNEATNKTIERHVKDMKKCFNSASIYLVASILACVSSASVDIQTSKYHPYLEKASPIQWQETNKFVSPGYMHIKMRLTYTSPCILLQQIPEVTNEVDSAIARCETFYQNDIVKRLEQLVRQNAGQQPSTPSMQQPGSYHNQPVINQPPGNQIGIGGGYLPQPIPQPPVYIPPKYGHQQPLINGRGRRETGEKEEFIREKRDWGITTAFATYAIISNVVNKVIDRFWPNAAVKELQERQEQIQTTVAEVNQRQNISMLLQDAMSDALYNQAHLIQNNAAEIDRIAYSHPELMVVTGHIMANLVQTGSQLDRLRIAFRARRPDLELLTLLTGTTFLDNLDQETIPKNSVELTNISPETIEIKFVARMIDRTTSVYDVDAFDFWANLTEEVASVMHYNGPTSLIYNHSINCIKGITGVKNLWVNAHCRVPDFIDMSLSSWISQFKTSDPWGSDSPVMVKESWPYTLIKCMSHNITVNNVTAECPHYIARINATRSFNISNGYSYSFSAMEYKINLEVSFSEIAAVHFKGQSFETDETHSIKEIRRLRRIVHEANDKMYVHTWKEGGGISYFQVALCVLTICTVGGLSYFLYESKKVEEDRHQELKEIVNSTYGSRLYEIPDLRYLQKTKQDVKPNLKSHSTSTTVVNVHGIPTTSSAKPTIKSEPL